MKEKIEALAAALTEVETLRKDAGVISARADQASSANIHMREDDFLAMFDPSEFVMRDFGHGGYPYEAVVRIGEVEVFALPVRSTAKRLIESGVRVES